MNKKGIIIVTGILIASAIVSRLATRYLLKEANIPYCPKCGKGLVVCHGWYCSECDTKY